MPEFEVKTWKTRRWSNPRMIDVPAAIMDKLNEQGLVCKYVHEDKLQSRLNEGWAIVTEHGQATTMDGKSLDGAYRVKELVLCAMPREMRDERNAFYRERQAKREAAVKRAALVRKVAGETNKANERDVIKNVFAKVSIIRGPDSKDADNDEQALADMESLEDGKE